MSLALNELNKGRVYLDVPFVLATLQCIFANEVGIPRLFAALVYDRQNGHREDSVRRL